MFGSSSTSSSSPRSRSSFDSLFSERGPYEDAEDHPPPATATRSVPPIPGLWVFPSLLPDEVAHRRGLGVALEAIGHADLFFGGTRDQVMLFEAPKHLHRGDSDSGSNADRAASSLPTYIRDLLGSIQRSLGARLSAHAMGELFDQPLARQVILNLYPPGQGISPHIDLAHRYADGIVGCSLTGGCVMVLTKAQERHDIYMPPRTVYVLSGSARWEWAHGIEGRQEDVVLDRAGRSETILRDLRVSVTFRWMKEGADVLS